MKNKLPLLFFLVSIFVFVPGHVFSQHFLGAVSAGLNLSQVDGDEVYGFKRVGFNGGPSVIVPFGKNKRWSVTMELLYSQLGSRQKNQLPSSDTIKDSTRIYDGYRLSLNYVQIPVIIHFTDKRKIAAGIGLQYGRLVGVKEYENHDDPRGFIRTNTNLRGPYSQTDLEALADVRVRIWQKLWLNVRYSYSFLNLRTREYIGKYYSDTWTRKQYNNVITIRFVYIFNDILPDKYSKKSESDK